MKREKQFVAMVEAYQLSQSTACIESPEAITNVSLPLVLHSQRTAAAGDDGGPRRDL